MGNRLKHIVPHPHRGKILRNRKENDEIQTSQLLTSTDFQLTFLDVHSFGLMNGKDSNSTQCVTSFKENHELGEDLNGLEVN